MNFKPWNLKIAGFLTCVLLHGKTKQQTYGRDGGAVGRKARPASGIKVGCTNPSHKITLLFSQSIGVSQSKLNYCHII